MCVTRRVWVFLLALAAAGSVFAEPVPSLDELAGEWQAVERLEQTPALSNFRGALAATRNLLGVTDYTQAPLSMGGATAELSVGGEALGAAESRWSAYETLRRAKKGNLAFQSSVRMVSEAGGVLFRVEVINAGTATETPEIRVALNGRVRRYDTTWEWGYPRPEQADVAGAFDAVIPEGERGLLVVRDRDSAARAAFWTAVEAVEVRATAHEGEFVWRPALEAGKSATLKFVMSVGSDEAKAVEAATLWAANFDEAFEAARLRWQERFEAAFRPGSGHFSGWLPVLETEDAAVKRVYYTSALAFLSMERTQYGPAYPRVFVTCSPKYAASVTYFWDCIGYSTLWSLLDPAGAREQIKLFLQADVHRCYAIDFLTLKGVGPWYGANDYTVFNLCHTYLRVTGDWGFLDERIGERTVADLMEQFSLHWKKFVSGESGLANYGTKDNLLETVPTYLERVASFNAANVWMMRTMADIRERRGEKARADELRGEADRLAQEVMNLYVPGKGYWCCLMSDGRRVEVRHCIDFFTVGQCMAGDLDEKTKSEMMGFVERELVTEHWLRALSLEDGAAKDSPRADHGSTGSYDAWPALTLETFLRMGQPAKALGMLRSVAAVTAEGPFGQSRYVEADGYPVRKAAAGGQDYFEGCGGAFAEVVLRGFFGIAPQEGEAAVRESGEATGLVGKVVDVKVGGRRYDVISDGEGVRVVGR